GRGKNGDVEAAGDVRVRPLRHLPVVPRSRAARQRQYQAPAREDSHLERLRGAPQLRRVLAAAGRRSLPHPRHGAHAHRGGMVGPGRLLWPPEDLRAARAARQRARQLARGGAVESRRLGRPGGGLSFDAPTRANAFDSYVADPAHPVPYRHRPIPATYTPQGSGWPVWLVEDQRFVDDRPDVLTWQTEPLTEDVTIAGAITAKLFVATTGTDGDWIVKLIDVYTEQYPKDPKLAGWELMVANDVVRARFRSSFVTPAPLTPNHVTPLTIDLHSQDYRFLKGHRIMVQVQSTWFPLIDRNPQSFLPNIFEARASDYRPATVRVYRSARWPSSVEVHLVKE